LWEAVIDEAVAVLIGHENRVANAAFCPEGRQVPITSDD
jgi:hypothetical protein